MLLFLTIALINLALGFAIGMLLKRRLDQLALQSPEVAEETQEAPTNDGAEEDGATLQPTPTAGPESAPEKWTEILFQEAIAPNSLLEAAVHVLRLKAAEHLEESIELTRELANHREDENAVEAAEIPRRDVTTSQAWLNMLNEAQGVLEQQFGKFGDLAEIQIMIDTAITAHASEMNARLEQAKAINFGTDFREAYDATAENLRSGISAVTSFQDYLDEIFAELIIAEDRLDEVDAGLRIDASTNLLNRCGIEQAIRQYQKQDDPQLSGVCFEIDQFAQLSHYHDIYIGDRLLKTLARVLDENIRKSRGFDRLAKLSQGRLFLLLGETDVNQAGHPAERIRKLVSSAQFKYGRVDMKLSISAVITEFRRNDRLENVLGRVDQGFQEALAQDGNLTVVYRSGKYDPITPNDDPVRKLEIEIDEREEIVA